MIEEDKRNSVISLADLKNEKKSSGSKKNGNKRDSQELGTLPLI